MLVNLIEGDGLGNVTGYLLALRLVCLLQRNAYGGHLAAVGDRDGYVLVETALLLIYILDYRPGLLREGFHPAAVNSVHIVVQRFCHLGRLGGFEEFLVEARLDGKGSHHIFGEGAVVVLFCTLREYLGAVLHHIHHVDLDTVSDEGVAALGVDDLTLGVHHVVVFEQALTYAEVVLLDLLLGAFYGVGKHSALESFIVLHSKLVHHGGYPLGTEQTHQLVFQ